MRDISVVLYFCWKADLNSDEYTTLLAWNKVDITIALMVASLPVLNALFPSSRRSRARAGETELETEDSLPSLSSSTTRRGVGSRISSVLPKTPAESTNDVEMNEMMRENGVEQAYASSGQDDSCNHSYASRPATRENV